jgi:hypothetical protein
MKNLKTLGKHNYGRPKKQEKKCGSGEKLTGVHARSTSRTFLLPPAEPSPGAWRYSLTSDLPPNERVGSLQGLAEGRGCRARILLERSPRGCCRKSSPPRISNRRHHRPGKLGGNVIWVGMHRGVGGHRDGWEVRVSGSGTRWFGGSVWLSYSGRV